MDHIPCQGLLPVRSVPTFIELLIGAMLTQTGFVTGAWLALGVQMARMVVTFFPQPV